ncbi:MULTISPECIES: spore germination protein [unclassified Paenibacillus]|uniref:spore germination protein n=1 Tax=unclassified Paenibacillus TaxID=185978 RepID=UPI00070BCA83|nr:MULTISPECIES: spore germination protein [unclassified Paenibacillus]KQX64682.1 hypothetical protein ASD40_02545 [Paenibacillus sp. Root444D2]KRE51935.1 hypothetical protein ASG85_02025 [Paenibacillus sp. Soil724D2]
MALFFTKKKKRKLQSSHPTPTPSTQQKLDCSLSMNAYELHDIFENCSEIVFREITFGTSQKIQAQMIWVDGLVEREQLENEILESLLHKSSSTKLHPDSDKESILESIKNSVLSVAQVSELTTIGDVVDKILTGETIVLFDRISIALSISTKGGAVRTVSEPQTEVVVRGPRQGFTESLRTNTTLVRRILKTPKLKTEVFKIGVLTKTEVVIAYIHGLASLEVLDEVRERLSQIDVDTILDSAYIEELIEDHSYTLFPQIAHTERPDKAAAELAEGKVVLFVDGSPFVLIIPTIFFQFFQSSEDYYERFPMAFAVRLIRYLFFAIALVLPSFYIAVITYHHEMLPAQLLISIAGSHEGVPFPTFIEALLMEITFEALREAGVRLPKQVGQAVSIVGALVIGESAVQAGIVSTAMVIVVAITAIASFTIPAFSVGISIRLMRFPLMLLGAVLGLYGIMLGLLALLVHLCSLSSFGVPYFSPIAPFKWRSMKDLIVRAPIWAMNRVRLRKPNRLPKKGTE